MDRVGTHGLQMMYRTCTVQVNLDFASEADMVQKLRVALALQPVATALFANSPVLRGQAERPQVLARAIWRDLDPDRTGMLPFVFDEGFGFERYVDYALDVPMYFVYRDGRYIDALGQSFRDFLGQAAGAARRGADAVGLGRPSDHDLPRGAAEALHRDARRRWRPVAAALRAAGAVGRADLRPGRAGCGLGPGKGWDAETREALRVAASVDGLAAEVGTSGCTTSRARSWPSPRPG
jgi:glutamate--cysteine ligase